MPRELQREISLHARVHIGGAVLVNVPPAVLELPPPEVRHAFFLKDQVHLTRPMHVEHVVRAKRAIDEQLPAPVSVVVLEPHEIRLRAPDRRAEAVAGLFAFDRLSEGHCGLCAEGGRCGKHDEAAVARRKWESLRFPWSATAAKGLPGRAATGMQPISIPRPGQSSASARAALGGAVRSFWMASDAVSFQPVTTSPLAMEAAAGQCQEEGRDRFHGRSLKNAVISSEVESRRPRRGGGGRRKPLTLTFWNCRRNSPGLNTHSRLRSPHDRS